MTLNGQPLTTADLSRAFTEWDRRYRANPQGFMSDVEHLCGHKPESYGELCAVYFVQLLSETHA